MLLSRGFQGVRSKRKGFSRTVGRSSSPVTESRSETRAKSIDYIQPNVKEMRSLFDEANPVTCPMARDVLPGSHQDVPSLLANTVPRVIRRETDFSL